MIDMDYEKAYKEALERARKLYNEAIANEYTSDAEDYLTIFPELAESEDERIRKKIIHILQVSGYMSPEEKDKAFAYLEKQKEQKPADKFQEYLNASPAERRKMNMDEILGDNKGHQKTTDALTTDSNKEADTSDCKYKNLDDIAQEYVDGVRQYNPEPTWDLMQTAVCYGYHLAEQKEQKPADWGEEDEEMIRSILFVLESYVSKAECEQSPALTATYPTYYKEIDWIKSLRPVNKEWSEEDEKTIDDAYCWLCEYAGSLIQRNYGKSSMLYGIANKLKSLRPSWKPTEEQMEALEECGECKRCIKELYEQYKRN